jgi:hypothetical protein
MDYAPSPAAEPLRVDISLDRIRETVNIGARRAALFMGLGLNAVARDDFTDYKLHAIPVKDPDGVSMEFLPDAAPPELLRTFKSEFSAWLVGAALQELLEHLAAALDMTHHAALFVLSQKDRPAFTRLTSEPDAMHNNFVQRKGVAEKMQALRERFEIASPNEERVASLYRARNCLAHGLGHVTAKAANEDDALVVRWLGLVMEGVGDESKQVFTLSQLKAAPLKESAMLRLRVVEVTRRFPVGERITFTHDELSQICHFVVNMVTGTIVQSAIAYMAKHGIEPDPPTAGRNDV